MTKEPFGTWLRRQAHRNDLVGDLARDFRDSGSRSYSERGVRADMLKHGAGGPAWAALECALDEWGA